MRVIVGTRNHCAPFISTLSFNRCLSFHTLSEAENSLLKWRVIRVASSKMRARALSGQPGGTEVAQMHCNPRRKLGAEQPRRARGRSKVLETNELGSRLTRVELALKQWVSAFRLRMIQLRPSSEQTGWKEKWPKTSKKSKQDRLAGRQTMRE